MLILWIPLVLIVLYIILSLPVAEGHLCGAQF